MQEQAAQDAPTAVFFDGRSNRKRRVALRFGEALEIVEDGVALTVWPYDRVRRADGPPGLLRLSCDAAPPLARLEIADPATQATLLSRCRALEAGTGRHQTARIVFWSLAAACSIVVLAWWGIPHAADRMAPLIPFAWEKRLGDAVDRQVRANFEDKVCTGAEGQAAFTALVDKIKAAGGLTFDAEAQILASGVPNAVALPGGKVYLFDGLLQKAYSADEIAAVLAHELGHVQNRDSLRALIQAGGTSFLLGLLFGDVTGAGAVIFAARTILSASYSREQEQRADAFAVGAMHALGRSPKPLGELLVRLGNAQLERALSILSSHPLSEGRLAEMTRQDRPATGPPLLSDAEWQALKGICR
jgi:Zn-dependent protease with chaperone function